MKPSPELKNVFYLIKYYAVEIAATVTFLTILAKAVWHEITM